MKRILVIDDNLDLLEVFKILFEAKGYEVFPLANGEIVLETIKQFSPDIILLDLFLGNINGIEICEQLKIIPETAHLPVILISANSNIENIFKLCHADAVVQKPFNVSYLISVVEAQLNKMA